MNVLTDAGTDVCGSIGSKSQQHTDHSFCQYTQLVKQSKSHSPGTLPLHTTCHTRSEITQPTLRVTTHNSRKTYCSEGHGMQNCTAFNSQYFKWGLIVGGGESRRVKWSCCSIQGSLLLTDHKLHSQSAAIQHIATGIFSVAVNWEMFCKLCVFVQGEGRRGERAVCYTVTLCRGLCDMQ